MGVLVRYFATVFLLVGTLFTFQINSSYAKDITISAPPPLNAHDTSLAKRAIESIKVGHWKKARKLISRIKDPLTIKTFRWLDYLDEKSTVPFADIKAFMENNPKWPSQKLLQRRAEEAMEVSLADKEILEWFEDKEPVSSDGLIRLGTALLQNGQKTKAVSMLRKTWREGNFGRKQERQFYKQYRRYLTYDDHIKRIDRLIWEDRYSTARRNLVRIKGNDLKLANARLALMRKRGGVDRAISKLPKDLHNDPGFVYERLRWRRKKGRHIQARELLDPPPETTPYPEKWWRERSILAREALKRGHVTESLRLVLNHGLEKGAAFADAEWFAGWIYLRFLKEPQNALAHFTKMYEAVSYPISRARGAYWAGRTAEQLGKKELTRKWYLAAAEHSTAYYGQLAAKKLGGKKRIHLPREIFPTVSERREFAKNELVIAIHRLHQIGLKKELKPFILALDRSQRLPGWRGLTAELAQKVKRHDLAIIVSKRALQDGHGFVGEGYPVVTIPRQKPESALVLAVIRQESRFSATAKSHAGARGLMQLMPRTARLVAKKERVRYSKSKLLTNPSYNIKLGRSYLRSLVERYEGSYPLALAAYNAGPQRANKWINEHGDPRDPTVDQVDWVEKIPFKETRNYVQRVLENLNIYRVKLGISKLAYKE
ncbi:MAG: lytic transglycosylase domain-containing protein [Rhodospirillales bacterium]|nr:lytic transglycosylase domain-containing protein [Rhodospirillales bacterium]